MQHNPWIYWMGGNMAFRDVPVGGSFRFVHSDVVMRKVSPLMDRDPTGQKYRTGAGCAVVYL